MKKNTPSPLEQKIEELEAALLTAQEKAEEANQKALRAMADLENVRRRESENKANWVADGISFFLKMILPSLLELQLGKEYSSDETMKKVVDKFFSELEKSGLQKIDPKPGTPVDPELHEVLMTEESKKGGIVKTLEIGWKFKDNVIAPAKVSANSH